MSRQPDAIVYALRDVMVHRGHGSAVFELHIPHLLIPRGQILFVTGRSGSGKSTLLDLLAGTLAPDRAAHFQIFSASGPARDLADLWRRRCFNALAALRGRSIGYVLQTGGLLPYLSVGQNIALTARIAARADPDHIQGLSQRLGIAPLLGLPPDRLSVGERQRVAIARALAHRPDILLADEPTASLDPSTAEQVFDLLIETVDRLGTTAVIASHDPARIGAAGGRTVHHSLRRDADAVRACFWS